MDVGRRRSAAAEGIPFQFLAAQAFSGGIGATARDLLSGQAVGAGTRKDGTLAQTEDGFTDQCAPKSGQPAADLRARPVDPFFE